MRKERRKDEKEKKEEKGESTIHTKKHEKLLQSY
jgi:hypothetical protein